MLLIPSIMISFLFDFLAPLRNRYALRDVRDERLPFAATKR